MCDSWIAMMYQSMIDIYQYYELFVVIRTSFYILLDLLRDICAMKIGLSQGMVDGF